MIICKNCGTQLPDNTKICTFCGANIDVVGYVPCDDLPYRQAPQQYYAPPPANPSNPGLSQPDNTNPKREKLIKSIALIAALAALVGIGGMIATGYYDPSGKNTQTIAAPERSTTAVPNTANQSPVTIHNNDVYILTSSENQYTIKKLDSSGNTSDIYSSALLMTDLNSYGDRLYFLTRSYTNAAEYPSVCSVSVDGTDFRTEIAKGDISGLFIYGSSAYYIVDSYGTSGDGAAVFKKDLSTGKTTTIAALDAAEIDTVIEYQGKVWIQYTDIADYTGHILSAYAGSTKTAQKLDILDNEEDIFSITAADGLIYFTNLKYSGTHAELYSMSTDGSGIKKIADTGGYEMLPCEDYIYYTQVYTSGDSTSYSYDGSELSYEFRRIKKDGTNDMLISTKRIYHPGIADDKIYYFDPFEREYFRISLDGASS